METYDVVVLGAGLAGLSAARDLAAAGTDVLVLEARARAGGRVEQATAPDGRLVQLGGEVVGTFHTAYRDLARELGLTLVPSFSASGGEETWLVDGTVRVGDMPWMDDADHRNYEQIERAYAALAKTVRPEDPWSHPDAAQLDRLSVADWLRSQGATPNTLRAIHLVSHALALDSFERISMLSDLRQTAAAGATGFYSWDVWENERVLEGSATVALRMAEQLGSRVRYSSAVSEVHVSRRGCTVRLVTGETFAASAVVSALPVGPLRDVHISGVSDERLGSLRGQRSARAAKVAAVYETSFWEEAGQDATGMLESLIIGGTWAQSPGVLSGLIPPASLGEFHAAPPGQRQRELTAELVKMFGQGAANHSQFYVRDWARDPWTQGYVTGWRPGDVMRVGPLHGTHEPPFYVCGSDQWVAGYMEGAVRTGRATAAAVLETN